MLSIVSRINSQLLKPCTNLQFWLTLPFCSTSSIGSIDSPLSSSITPQSFIPGLKPSFSANPSHRSLPFLLQDWLHGFPGLFTNTSEHMHFYFLVFFSLLVVASMHQIKLTYAGFWAQEHLTSYCIIIVRLLHLSDSDGELSVTTGAAENVITRHPPVGLANTTFKRQTVSFLP